MAADGAHESEGLGGFERFEGGQAEKELAGFGGAEWQDGDAMEKGFEAGDGIAAGEEETAATAILGEITEIVGEFGVGECAAAGSEVLFEIIED